EHVRVDGLELAVRGDGGRLPFLIPLAELLAPELLRIDLLCTLEAFGDLNLWRRHHLLVGEAVHVDDLDAVDQEPVEACEVVRALLEDRRVSLLEIARHRTREVHGVLEPVARAGRVEAERGRVRRAHPDLPLSRQRAKRSTGGQRWSVR